MTNRHGNSAAIQKVGLLLVESLDLARIGTISLFAGSQFQDIYWLHVSNLEQVAYVMEKHLDIAVLLLNPEAVVGKISSDFERILDNRPEVRLLLIGDVLDEVRISSRILAKVTYLSAHSSAQQMRVAMRNLVDRYREAYFKVQ